MLAVVLRIPQEVTTVIFWAVLLRIPQHITNMTFWNWISCITFTTSKNPTHTCKCYQNCDLWNQIPGFVDSPSSFLELLPGYFCDHSLVHLCDLSLHGFPDSQRPLVDLPLARSLRHFASFLMHNSKLQNNTTLLKLWRLVLQWLWFPYKVDCRTLLS